MKIQVQSTLTAMPLLVCCLCIFVHISAKSVITYYLHVPAPVVSTPSPVKWLNCCQKGLWAVLELMWTEKCFVLNVNKSGSSLFFTQGESRGKSCPVKSPPHNTSKHPLWQCFFEERSLDPPGGPWFEEPTQLVPGRWCCHRVASAPIIPPRVCCLTSKSHVAGEELSYSVKEYLHYNRQILTIKNINSLFFFAS